MRGRARNPKSEIQVPDDLQAPKRDTAFASALEIEDLDFRGILNVKAGIT